MLFRKAIQTNNMVGKKMKNIFLLICLLVMTIPFSITCFLSGIFSEVSWFFEKKAKSLDKMMNRIHDAIHRE